MVNGKYMCIKCETINTLASQKKGEEVVVNQKTMADIERCLNCKIDMKNCKGNCKFN